MGDWDRIEAGLKSVGKADLLPPKPVQWGRRPLCWWGNVKALLKDKAAGQSLALGMLYQDIFPEHMDRVKNWHHAGTDVEMTIALINAYFTRAQGKPLAGKIDAYFPPIPLPPEDAKLLIDNLSEEQREEVVEEGAEGPEDVDDEDDIDLEDDEWDEWDEWDEMFAPIDELDHFQDSDDEES